MATARKPETGEPQKASQIYKALSNDLRLRVLTLLTEQALFTERETLSPVMMAAILDADVKIISHHAKQLVKYGCAEEVETRPRRGAVEHFYRATTRPVLDGEDWEALPLPAKMAATKQAAQGVLDDLKESFLAKVIDRRVDRHFTRAPFVVDEQGWKKLQEIHRRAFTESLKVQVESDKRRAKSGEKGIRVSSSQLCFEMPPLSKR